MANMIIEMTKEEATSELAECLNSTDGCRREFTQLIFDIIKTQCSASVLEKLLQSVIDANTIRDGELETAVTSLTFKIVDAPKKVTKK